MLCYAGKSVTIDYERVTPETVMVIKAGVEVTLNAEPDGAANGSQPIRSEKNGTSSAAGSRR